MSMDRVVLSLHNEDMCLVHNHAVENELACINSRLNALVFFVSALSDPKFQSFTNHASCKRIVEYTTDWIHKHRLIKTTYVDRITNKSGYIHMAKDVCYDMVAALAIQLGVTLLFKHILCDTVDPDSQTTIGDVTELLKHLNSIHIFCATADPSNNQPRMGVYMLCVEFIRSIMSDDQHSSSKLSHGNQLRLKICMCIMDDIMSTCAKKHKECAPPEQQLTEQDVQRFKFFNGYYHSVATQLQPDEQYK